MVKKTRKAAKKKAVKEAASRLTRHRVRGGGRHARAVDGPTSATAADTRALPHPQFTLEHVEASRVAIETLTTLADRGPDGLESKADRLLATTSEIRELIAQSAKAQSEILRRVALLEENQRPPAPTPDREAAARNAGIRWTLANQCRALGLVRPTPLIVGRVMSDERALDQRTAKSPLHIFQGILNTVRLVFRLPPTHLRSEAAPGQDHVHLTEELVAVIEERSSIPKKKQGPFLDDKLKFEFLTNSGLAEKIKIAVGARTSYARFLTPMGGEVFNGWPAWTDKTGGIGLADKPETPHKAPATIEPDASATASKPPPASTSRPPPA
jgi:hypothetical protein